MRRDASHARAGPLHAGLAACLLASLAMQCGGFEWLVSSGVDWRYWDQGGLDASPDWMMPAFSDASWASGPSELGYGDGDEATVVGYGGNPQDRFITTYFRREFEVTSIPAHLVLDFKRDDAVVIYLNGVEILRDNLPAGPISSETLAISSNKAHESRTMRIAVDPGLLLVGTNLVAAEIHQNSQTSSDMSFDLSLVASDSPFVPQLVRGPYLQLATPTSVQVRWRTDLAAESTVRYGPGPEELTAVASTEGSTGEHEVTLSGLSPGTKVYYSVGTPTRTLAGGDDAHYFFTPDPVGVRRPVRIWAVGDSGAVTQTVQDVQAAFLADSGARRTDVFLMLGDNAYLWGTDLEMQLAVFETFGSLIRRTALWPSVGNHDAVSSPTVPQSGPYFAGFTLPTAGEAGGLPSGTEAYFSYDFANVHFVVLDTEGNDRSPGGAMLSWLGADLAANQQDWTIAYFHRPPYSKGSHDSDVEGPMVQMRQNALPILEAGGVDLVLTGHSHSYERSMLLDGHYGDSTTLTPAMVLDAGDGDPQGDGAYQKPTLGPASSEGTVYVVAGSSAAARAPGTEGPLDHPVMIRAANVAASVVLDVHRGVLDARVLTDTGQVLDRFRIEKPAPPAECADGLDNDADGQVDHWADAGCADAGSAYENPDCDDGVDNDGDGHIDLADANCGGEPSGASEAWAACGLGSELAPALVALWLARRRLRP